MTWTGTATWKPTTWVCEKCGNPPAIRGRTQIKNAVCPKGGRHEWKEKTDE